MALFTVIFVAVTLLKPHTRIYQSIEMWIGHRTSRRQNKTIKANPTGIDYYQYLQQRWNQEPMGSFENFLRWQKQ